MDRREWDEKDWCFSILSDAQELIRMGFKKEATEKINQAKKVLRGKYNVVEEGFAIEVQK